MNGFGLRTSECGDWSVLEVRGEVDLATAPHLRDALCDLVSEGAQRIVVDFTPTDFLDSTGLGALVTGLKRLRAHKGEMRLVCPTPRVRKVFEVTHLERVVPVFASLEEACKEE